MVLVDKLLNPTEHRSKCALAKPWSLLVSSAHRRASSVVRTMSVTSLITSTKLVRAWADKVRTTSGVQPDQSTQIACPSSARKALIMAMLLQVKCATHGTMSGLTSSLWRIHATRDHLLVVLLEPGHPTYSKWHNNSVVGVDQRR